MHGIVALLDDEHTARVEGLWDELSEVCGLSCVQLTPFPHFSWHIAEDYDFDRLEAKLTHITQQTSPFKIHTAGLGVFTGEHPVVYLQVVKDPQLLNLHGKIWEGTQGFGSEVSHLYAPDQWMPHITLANRDVSDENIPCIFSLLGKRPFKWEIEVGQFAIGYQHDDAPGEITKTFPLNSHRLVK
jgi:2'-5' RNA ligase